jgi:hypothetical protein
VVSRVLIIGILLLLVLLLERQVALVGSGGLGRLLVLVANLGVVLVHYRTVLLL